MANDNTNKGAGMPTFAPPSSPPQFSAPTFQAPQYNGPVCFHHNTERAVARCARCGKNICKDCAEVYSVSEGEYKDKCLCFDCCEQLVADNIDELTQNKATIKKQFILQIVGMVVGAIFGLAYALDGGGVPFWDGVLLVFIFMCVGGVFLSAVKAYFIAMWEAFKLIFTGEGGWIAAMIYFFLQIVVILVQCAWHTISNTIKYIIYLKRTSGFIESDTEALQQMRDYMEYTLVRNQNKGVDLETLMTEGSELFNNSYAQMVRDNGEEAADASLRQATTRIAENGEIIREFPAAA